MARFKFQSPTGMHDILPRDLRFYIKIYRVAKKIIEFYGFSQIETPIIEKTELFTKGTGLGTDIVQKEMYSFKTKGGDELSLRPEGTPSVVRAYIQQGMFSLPQPVKLWYFGPYFRHEKPQAGRYRQFWQLGIETLGEKNPVTDAQIIQIFYLILKKLKFKNLIVDINSIGDQKCRPYYKKLLRNFLRTRERALCADCRRRLKINPLRVLDCKQEKCQRIISQAPQIIEHLCEECHDHFKEVLEFLDEIEIPYNLNPYLVRGLDYYTKTVFEIYENTPQGRTLGALVGGGRYDGLVKLLGGKDTPAVGGAAGIERIIDSIKKEKIRFPKPPRPQIFLAQLGVLAKRKSLKLLEEFRKADLPIAATLGKNSLKAQLSRANKIGAKYVLILGQKEALEGKILIRDMKTGKQETIKIEKVVEEMKRRLKSK